MMKLPQGKSLILFDGWCHLCSRFVQLVLKYDRKRIFLFAPLDSPVGTYWKKQRNVPDKVDTVILIEADGFLMKSDAALKIAEKLGGLFNLVFIFRILPKKIRDRLYDFVARNRFRWFGKRQHCMLPTREQQERFLSSRSRDIG